MRAYIQAMGWQAVPYFEKESSGKHRPEFERLMDDAKQRKFDVLVVWKLDRIARRVLPVPQSPIKVTGSARSI
jgi:site-specific DNA recombinase